MMDGEALLRAIRDAPEDDTVRLVYADWLDEMGDTGPRFHANFIRNQIEGKYPKMVPLTLLAELRAGGVFHPHQCDQNADLSACTVNYGGPRRFVFRRGFLDEISVPEEQFTSVTGSVFSLFAHPVTKVALIGKDPGGWFGEDTPWWEPSRQDDILPYGNWRLPPEIYALLCGGREHYRGVTDSRPDRRYESRQDALDDLSRACVILGRGEYAKLTQEKVSV